MNGGWVWDLRWKRQWLEWEVSLVNKFFEELDIVSLWRSKIIYYGKMAQQGTTQSRMHTTL